MDVRVAWAKGAQAKTEAAVKATAEIETKSSAAIEAKTEAVNEALASIEVHAANVGAVAEATAEMGKEDGGGCKGGQSVGSQGGGCQGGGSRDRAGTRRPMERHRHATL